MEAVEPEPSEARMAPPADAAHMADANMAHANMADTGMTDAADRARRGAARGERECERGARRCRDCQLTQHLLLHVRMRPQTSAIARGSYIRPDPQGHRLARYNTASAQTLRSLPSNFQERYPVQSNNHAAANCHKQIFIKEN
jgi:hypothetical protein